mmetsp:Transcript_6594/g.10783  ORF Transcript_6594/g.10783 Transcript_6594/m.10783 type:complete len:210 (-) Transcript_6594:1728-2357(-)
MQRGKRTTKPSTRNCRRKSSRGLLSRYMAATDTSRELNDANPIRCNIYDKIQTGIIFIIKSNTQGRIVWYTQRGSSCRPLQSICSTPIHRNPLTPDHTRGTCHDRASCVKRDENMVGTLFFNVKSYSRKSSLSEHSSLSSFIWTQIILNWNIAQSNMEVSTAVPSAEDPPCIPTAPLQNRNAPHNSSMYENHLCSVFCFIFCCCLKSSN